MISLLNKYLKDKFQVAQNFCIRLSLDLPPYSHIDAIHLGKIDWFPVSKRITFCNTTTAFKYWNGIAIVPSYVNNMFIPSYNKYYNSSLIALVFISMEKKYRATDNLFLY